MTTLLNMPRAAWKRQPTGRVTVNWSHPSTRRLRFAFSGGTWMDAVTGQSLVAVGSPSRTPTSDGVALTVEGSGTGTRLELGINPTVPTTEPVSVLTKARCFLTTFVRRRLFQLNNATTGTVVTCDFNSGSMSDNRITAAYQTPGGTYPGTVSTADYVAHTPYALLFTHDGSSSSYVDITRLNGPLSVTNAVSPGARRSAIDTIRLGNSSSFPFNGSLPYLFFWDRLISTDEAALIYQNPWALFASAPSRFILIPSSGGLSSIQKDGLIRWHILSAIQQDASLKWDVKIVAQNDVLIRWNLLEGVLSETTIRWNSLASIQQDTLIRWNLLTLAQQDVIARWNALQSVAANQALRWDVLSEVLSAQNDATLRWNTLSTIQQDALLRWNLTTAIEQSLATRWNLLNAVEVSHTARWDIAVTVASEILLRWNSVESLTVNNDLNLVWDLLAVAENEIELRWNLGDSLVTPAIRVFLVRGEDRTFHISTQDRTFGVQ